LNVAELKLKTQIEDILTAIGESIREVFYKQPISEPIDLYAENPRRSRIWKNMLSEDGFYMPTQQTNHMYHIHHSFNKMPYLMLKNHIARVLKFNDAYTAKFHEILSNL
jgi:hypothetical protein